MPLILPVSQAIAFIAYAVAVSVAIGFLAVALARITVDFFKG